MIVTNRLVYIFTLGHFSVDWCQGAIPALLPYFIAHYGLSYQEAATLIFANVIVASVLQPAFGYFSDRVSKPWFIPLGTLMAGATMVWIAFSTTYLSLFLAAMVCGVASSIFHPEGALMVNRVAGKEMGKAMGTFSVGGNLGFAIGPAAAGLCAYVLDIHWLLFFFLVNVVLAAMILYKMPAALQVAAQQQKEEQKQQVQRTNRWGAFSKLAVCITGRSIAFELCNTFIPLYWIHVLGSDGNSGANALTALFTIGAILTYSGGLLADRFSMRQVIRMAFVVMVPAMYILFQTTNLTLGWLLLLPAAASIFMPYSPMVVLGQTYLAKNVGFASGVTLGLSTTLGGVIAPVVGWAADQWGLVNALQMLWMTALVCAVVSFTLPTTDRKQEIKK